MPELVAGTAELEMSKYFENFLDGARNEITPPLLDGLSLIDSVSVINFLALLISQHQPDIFCDKRSTATRITNNQSQAWNIVRGWPDAFYELLAARESFDYQASIATRTCTDAYRDVKDQLYRRAENEGVRRIAVAFSDYLATRGTMVALSPRLGESGPQTESLFITREAAAKILSTRPETVSKIARSGRIKTSVHGAKTVFSAVDTCALRDLRDKNFTVTESAEYLGLSVHQMRKLLLAELVVALEHPASGCRDWLVCKQSCEHLLIKLNELARLNESRQLETKWYSIKQLNVRGLSIDAIIEGSLSGLLICSLGVGNRSTVARSKVKSMLFTFSNRSLSCEHPCSRLDSK